MWYLWTALLVSSALVAAEGPAPATTRAPHRTLDRKAAELAWRTWLQSPESGSPPRRITTKSLFITPLVCPKGQRLDSNGCVQVVTVNKDEHERILLDQLQGLFTTSDVVYDYTDEDPGPLQLSIPIGLDPQAERLQAQEPSAQAQEQQLTIVKPDKKNEVKPDDSVGLVAELELLSLQNSQNSPNDTTSAETSDILNHNVLQPFDKPKRDSSVNNSTEVETNSDEGQKELVFGHVNIDPYIMFSADTDTEATTTETDTETPTSTEIKQTEDNVTESSVNLNNNTSVANPVENPNKTTSAVNTTHTLKKDGDQTKLNPENDYADIGEAIKLISRYAEVTTDDNFNNDQKKLLEKDDNVLGTRTKLQYRRNKPKPAAIQESAPSQAPLEYPKAEIPGYSKDRIPGFTKDGVLLYAKDVMPGYPKDIYYRYPWQGQHSPTPPPDYPFRHIQDYWPGRSQLRGVYNTGHENPRRHHHNYYYRSHSSPNVNYPRPYAGQQDGYPRRLALHHVRSIRSHGTNQDLYTLLGLRHWFSSEGTSKR